MNVYTTDKIRNVVLLGHGGAGKTSLLEAMAYLTGITSRLGSVADGTTLSDFDKEEQNRKFSINTSMAPIIWNDCKINVLDTPGYFDFIGEVEEAVAAADAAIIVVNGGGARMVSRSAHRRHGNSVKSTIFRGCFTFPTWTLTTPHTERLSRR
jgi:elongation factor G